MFKFTKNEQLILDLFFKKPEESFYVRQMGRLLNKEPGVFERDLNRLLEEKILLSQKIGNNVFYSLNKNYFLLPELKNIFKKTVGIEYQIKSFVNTFPEKINKAFIYGSVAANKENSASDIDLFLVGNITEPLLSEKIHSLETTLGREIHYVLMSPEEYKHKKDARDSFLNNIENKPIISLI
ncbi:MAG TPA: nucleotidyltransferase domain-containing protein [Candidatus Paceibacterota bacterium]|nr:nucleotidyltransferase domain-containing protein [Candidatus Paceibacterota bacterium]